MPKEENKPAVERNLVYGSQARETVAAKKGVASAGSRETDAHKLAQRLKQVEYGYNTLGYTNYRKAVPKAERKAEHPRTPERTKVMSKRAWEGLIRKWRRQLHEWDPKELQGVRGAGAPHARAGGDAAEDSTIDTGNDAASVATTRGAMCSGSDDDDDGLVACRPPADEDEGAAAPMSLVNTPQKSVPPPRMRAPLGEICEKKDGEVGRTPETDTPRDLNDDCYGDFTPEAQS